MAYCKTSRALALVSLTLLVATLPSCGDVEPVDPSFRWIDRIGELKIESAVDLAEGESLAFGDARELRSGRLDGLPQSTRHQGTWIASAIADRTGDAEPPELTLSLSHVQLAAAGGPIGVDVTLDEPLGDDERIFALLRQGPVDAATLADPARVEALLRQSRPFLAALDPVDGAPLRYRRLLDPTGMRTLLVGVAAVGDRGGARVTIRKLTSRGAWLLEPPMGSSPSVRRVDIGDITREALVVGAPGAITLRAELPERAPRLRFHAGLLFARRGAYAVAAIARRDGEERRVDRVLRAPGDDARWREVELSLDDFAGRPVELRFEVSGGDGSHPPALVCVGGPVVESDAAVEPFDVVLVSLDTVRADRLSIYGAPARNSPSLTRLEEDAVVFDNAIAAAAWTLPSHATMMSGQYPDRHAAHAPTSRIDASTRLMAEDFRELGYETVAFTGGGYVNPEFGFARGFEQYGIDDPAFPPPGWVEARGGGGAAQRLARSVRESKASLLECIARDRGRPLFLFVHTYAAHNYAAPPEVLREHGATDEQLEDLLRELKPGDEMVRWRSDSPSEREHAKWRTRFLYDASVRVADDLLGDVVDALKAAGRLDRTVLVVTSDHGEELLERDNIGHGQSLFDEQVRVPLVIRAPGLPAGRVGETVSLVDLAPTVRQLCDLEDVEPDRFDGRGLRPLLTGGSMPLIPALSRGNRRDLVQRSLRGSRTKLIVREQPDGTTARLLFHLDDDPDERTDVLAAHQEQAERIERVLDGLVEDLRARGVAGSGGALSGDVAARLRELGYLDD